MTRVDRDATGERDSSDDTRSKVGRLIQTYELDGMADELEVRWLGTGETQNSLRELADYFNHQLFHAAMNEAEMNPLEGEVENAYRLLTDDVSAGIRTQTRKRFEREGVDVDRLERDFVSHQAIHTYLTKYRNVQKTETTGSDRIEKSTETVQRLKNRLTAVTDNTLESLRETNRIETGDVDVSVDVRVFCHDCRKQYEVRELLEAGGCDCDSTTDA